MRFAFFLAPLLLMGTLAPAQTAPRTVAVCSLALEPLMLLWSESLTDGKLDVRANVATEVAKALIEGRSQIAPITREFKAEEIAAFTAKHGHPPTRVSIGVDALVILVHKDNPLKELKVEQLDAMWTTTRFLGWPNDLKVWGDIGVKSGNWEKRPIICVDRPAGSGLRDFFKSAVTKDGKLKESNHQSSDAMSMVEELLSNQAAIGYGSLGEVFQNLKAIRITPIGGKEGVDPTKAHVADGIYPLVRYLYVYFDRVPNQPIDPAVLAFLQHALSPQGQRQLESVDLVPLSPEMLTINEKKLK